MLGKIYGAVDRPNGDVVGPRTELRELLRAELTKVTAAELNHHD
jgi:hypothetical protein